MAGGRDLAPAWSPFWLKAKLPSPVLTPPTHSGGGLGSLESERPVGVSPASAGLNPRPRGGPDLLDLASRSQAWQGGPDFRAAPFPRRRLPGGPGRDLTGASNLTGVLSFSDGVSKTESPLDWEISN